MQLFIVIIKGIQIIVPIAIARIVRTRPLQKGLLEVDEEELRGGSFVERFGFHFVMVVFVIAALVGVVRAFFKRCSRVVSKLSKLRICGEVSY